MIEEIELRQTRWFINTAWYETHRRSLSVVLKGYLCSKCSKKLKAKEREVSVDTMLASIKSCCSGDKDFIESRMPVAEKVFRILLSNGNQPLELDEISNRIAKKTGTSFPTVSQQTLFRVINNDRYYGITQAAD